MPRFREIMRCAGVDEAAQTMVVPFNGTTVVALDGDDAKRLRLVLSGHEIVIQELPATSETIAALLKKQDDLRKQLEKPGSDRQEQIALSPGMLPAGTRYFAITGKTVKDLPGVTVKALPTGNNNAAATLQVVVLDERKFKLAIRHLQVPDADGNMIFHSKKPSDPKAECAYMNAVWTPQTNIVFQLISESPVVIDIRQEATRKELAQALGLKDPSEVQVPEFIDTSKLKAIFAKLKDPKADFTIFVVRGIGHYRSPINGRTIPEFGYALVSDIRDRTTMAHEVGHFLGGHPEKDGWKDLPDLQAPPEMLMRDGGAGWKIPLNLTMKFFRPFFDRKEKQQSKRGAAH